MPTAAAPYTAIDLYTLEAPPGTPTIWPSSGPQSAAGGQVVGTAHVGSSSDPTFALTWNQTSTPTELHPAGSFGSRALATNGTQQVGRVHAGAPDDEEQPGYSRAALWNSTPTLIDLHPTHLPGIVESTAHGTNGTQHVGDALVFNPAGTPRRIRHAVLWNGSAGSAIDLHPTNVAGFATSTAFGTDGNRQVGYGTGANSRSHALMWRGTSEAVDLHPTRLAGISDSVAYGVSGAQQVGYGRGADPGGVNGVFFHALLWNGTPEAVDLHPSHLAGLTRSAAYGTNGTRQVGYGTVAGTGDLRHALLWEGSAASAVDLHLLLPAGFTSSEASTIDAAGNVFGTAVDAAGRFHAIQWSVPEPAGVGILSLTLLGCLRRNRRR